MRPVNIGQPVGSSEEQRRKWVLDALHEIETASYETVEQSIADAFSVTNAFTERRTMDTTTVTLPQLAEYVATFVTDLKKRGSKRSS